MKCAVHIKIIIIIIIIICSSSSSSSSSSIFIVIILVIVIVIIIISSKYILQYANLDTSSVFYPGFIGCFGSYNRHPLPGDLIRVDQALACVQVAYCALHLSPLFR